MVIVLATPDHLQLRAPYHPSLPFRAGQIGGKWRGAEIGWVFARDQEAAVRLMCLDIWGLDGREESLREMVALRITVDERAAVRTVFEAINRPVYLVGREIAASLKNLKAARPGRGVRFISGQPRCRAQVDTWQTIIPNGAVFVIRDVPRTTVARLRAAVGSTGRVELDAATECFGTSRLSSHACSKEVEAPRPG